MSLDKDRIVKQMAHDKAEERIKNTRAAENAASIDKRERQEIKLSGSLADDPFAHMRHNTNVGGSSSLNSPVTSSYGGSSSSSPDIYQLQVRHREYLNRNTKSSKKRAKKIMKEITDMVNKIIICDEDLAKIQELEDEDLAKSMQMQYDRKYAEILSRQINDRDTKN
jgi:hypothetical protein